MAKKPHQTHWKDLRDGQPIVSTPPKLSPLTKNQGLYMELLEEKHAVVCTGPAGVGKSFLACWKAIQQLKLGKVQRIVLSRPLKKCGEDTGYYPGDMLAKVGSMMVPLFDALSEFLERGELERLMADEKILVVPLGDMRGRSFKGDFTILDEAQNATFEQLFMFVTRHGDKSRMVVCGDVEQSDLPYKGVNSLQEMVLRFKSDLHNSVGVMEMGEQDIVRSELCAWFHKVMTKSMKKR
jgi:phosphate starvation-inducible PhoH-like protein